METKKTHWRTLLETAFLSGEELQKEGQIVVIKDYEKVELYSPKSNSKEEHIVLNFNEFKKPMILTNRKAKQISKVLDSQYVEDWVGKSINIFPKEEKHFGNFMPVINIKQAVAQPKPPLTKSHENWEGAKSALKKGQTTRQSIEKHYSLTQEVKKELELIKVTDNTK